MPQYLVRVMVKFEGSHFVEKFLNIKFQSGSRETYGHNGVTEIVFIDVLLERIKQLYEHHDFPEYEFIRQKLLIIKNDFIKIEERS